MRSVPATVVPAALLPFRSTSHTALRTKHEGCATIRPMNGTACAPVSSKRMAAAELPSGPRFSRHRRDPRFTHGVGTSENEAEERCAQLTLRTIVKAEPHTSVTGTA
jgi:hypothetical protein